jgi:hypothetical protein
VLDHPRFRSTEVREGNCPYRFNSADCENWEVHEVSSIDEEGEVSGSNTSVEAI